MYWFDLDSAAKGPVAYQLTILYPPDPPPAPVTPKVIEEDEPVGMSAAEESEQIMSRLNDPLNSAQKKSTNAALNNETVKSQKAKPLFSALNPSISFERMGAVPAKKVTVKEIAWNERYAIVGAKSLDPLFVKDNGENTFVKFSTHQALPTVFAITADGDETRVSYSMQDDIMVIQRVSERFILRHGEQALCIVNLRFNPTGQTTGTKTVSPDVVRTIKGGVK